VRKPQRIKRAAIEEHEDQHCARAISSAPANIALTLPNSSQVSLDDGSVWLSVLGEDVWRPVMSVNAVVLAVQLMMLEPKVESGELGTMRFKSCPVPLDWRANRGFCAGC